MDGIPGDNGRNPDDDRIVQIVQSRLDNMADKSRRNYAPRASGPLREAVEDYGPGGVLSAILGANEDIDIPQPQYGVEYRARQLTNQWNEDYIRLSQLDAEVADVETAVRQVFQMGGAMDFEPPLDQGLTVRRDGAVEIYGLTADQVLGAVGVDVGGGDGFIVDHILGHALWSEIMRRDSLKWEPEHNANVAALTLHWGVNGVKKLYRREDGEYDSPRDWVTYAGLPGQSPFSSANPQREFQINTVESTNLSLYPFTSYGAMMSVEVDQQGQGGVLDGLVRVPYPSNADSPVADLESIEGVSYSHGSSLVQSRFSSAVQPTTDEEITHHHVNLTDIYSQKRALEVMTRLFDIVGEGSELR